MVPVSKQLSLFFSCFRAKHSGPVFSGHPVLTQDQKLFYFTEYNWRHNHQELSTSRASKCSSAFQWFDATVFGWNRHVLFIIVWKMNLYSKYVLWKGKSSIHQSYLACRHDFCKDVFLHVWCNRSRQTTETVTWVASYLCTLW